MSFEDNNVPDIHEQIDAKQESLKISTDDLNTEFSQDMADIDALQEMIKNPEIGLTDDEKQTHFQTIYAKLGKYIDFEDSQHDEFRNQMNQKIQEFMDSINEQTESLKSAEVFQAAQDLQDYISARTPSELNDKFVFGPNLDGAYWWRVGNGINAEGSASDWIHGDMQMALQYGVPHENHVTPFEKQIVNLSVVNGRIEKLDNGYNKVVVKHFPGGESFDIEQTEVHISTINSSDEGLQTSLASFRDILTGPNANKVSIMTSHALYPELQKQMSKKYPDIQGILPLDFPMPATFSPYILQGALREDLGYKGAIIADWLNMMSIEMFVMQMKMKPEFEGINSDSVVKAILAVDAGLNFSNNNIAAREWDIQEFQDYYDNHPEFQKKFEDMIRFNTEWFLKNNPKKAKNLNITGYNAESSMQDKLKMINFNFISDSWTDLWNRKGILTMEFRKNYIEQISGKDFPDLVDFGDKNMEYLQALKDNAEFQKWYKKIDWDSEDSQKAMKEAYDKMLKK